MYTLYSSCNCTQLASRWFCLIGRFIQAILINSFCDARYFVWLLQDFTNSFVAILYNAIFFRKSVKGQGSQKTPPRIQRTASRWRPATLATSGSYQRQLRWRSLQSSWKGWYLTTRDLTRVTTTAAPLGKSKKRFCGQTKVIIRFILCSPSAQMPITPLLFSLDKILEAHNGPR